MNIVKNPFAVPPSLKVTSCRVQVTSFASAEAAAQSDAAAKAIMIRLPTVVPPFASARRQRQDKLRCRLEPAELSPIGDISQHRLARLYLRANFGGECVKRCFRAAGSIHSLSAMIARVQAT